MTGYPDLWTLDNTAG